MAYETKHRNDVTIITIFLSRATLDKALKFKEYIMGEIEAGATKIIVDLSPCDFIDSTFLGALVASLKKVMAAGGDLKLVYDNQSHSVIFGQTRMDKVFKIFTDLDEAVESFSTNMTENL